MEKEILLKRAVVGGFDRKQVMDCISQLQTRANEAKSGLEELKSLQSTVLELEAIVAQKDNEIGKLSADIAEAEESRRVSKASAQLMRESVEYADQYVESARVVANDISEKTKLRVEDAKEQIDSILLDITRISSDILALYTSLTELKAEYDTFSDANHSASPENYLAEGEETIVEDSQEVQTVSPEAAQKESAPRQGESDAKALIRKAKEKYLSMT